MSQPIYQCCYTNITENEGGMVKSGWHSTAVSPNIPDDAYNTCVKLQNANSAFCANAVDEWGNALELLEITGDGSYLYVIRTQYGLSDRLGRPNMFSHAMIFPMIKKRDTVWKSEDVLPVPDDVMQVPNDILWDPNTFLALKPPAFKNEGNQLSRTGSPSRGPDLFLKDAMEQAGLDREGYAALVRCVYAQMSAPKGTDPLYVQYDGTEGQLWGMIYCIYFGIPRYMRKTLHIASCPMPNDSGKHLVFSRTASTKDRRVIPQTGENTVLIPRMERKISRLGYIDYAALHEKLQDFVPFFMNLENTSIILGDSTASNSNILKLAFQTLKGPGTSRLISELTEEELESIFSTSLRLFRPGRPRCCELMLECMLREVSRRNLGLNAENEALLDTWISNAKSTGLRDAGRAYKAKR